jgi:hypothetical protein
MFRVKEFSKLYSNLLRELLPQYLLKEEENILNKNLFRLILQIFYLYVAVLSQV